MDPQLIDIFWQVLEEFNHAQRVKYLKFVYGRGKLPTNLDSLKEKHKILRYLGDSNDRAFPKAQTW